MKFSFTLTFTLTALTLLCSCRKQEINLPSGVVGKTIKIEDQHQGKDLSKISRKILEIPKHGFHFEAIMTEKTFTTVEALEIDFQEDIPQRPLWRRQKGAASSLPKDSPQNSPKSYIEYLRSDFAIWLKKNKVYVNIVFSLRNEQFSNLNQAEYDRCMQAIDEIAEDFAQGW